MTDSEFLQRLGMEVKIARTRKKLTQKELASLSGLGKSVIWLLEGGKHNIRITTLKRIAVAMEMKVNDLLVIL